MNSDFRIGIIQHNPVVGDVTGNAEQISDEYNRLAESSADVVITPELSLLGYPPRDLLHRPGMHEAQTAAIQTIAAQTTDGPPLIVGAALEHDSDTGPPLSNAATVLRQGAQTAVYYKQLLPTYDVFDEHRYFRPGNKPLTVSIDGVDVGITICEDAWHDAIVTGQQRHEASPLADASADGAEIILTLSASPFSLDKPARREHRFVRHAQQTNCPVIFANQVGGNDELIFDGHSIVATSDGVSERFAGFESETAIVDVPLSQDHTNNLAAYSATTATQARDALGLGIRDYFAKTGFDEAVIGLSGGIDSSVAAALAVDALGPNRVYGISLPSNVTSQQSVDDAQTVAQNLGIAFDIVPIGTAVQTAHQTLSEHAESLTGIAAENIQARIRGDMLMGLANERDALVLTPDNKSEAAVGYCTLYGDTVGALAPLGDCYKQIVYQLASAFNDRPPVSARSSPVIPSSVIERPPSAELREDQTDTEELPAYEQLDPILRRYLETNDTGAALRDEYPDDVVKRTIERVSRAEFKRRQTPPPLRITQKALGRGWNYPIAAEYEHIIPDEG
ncbi:MAG: NAD+ synthetase [Haloquadratum sp. J07HQX50]|nr:MAG: NAD+ synthetase [Haloquadratum sp. J07HQX50]